MYFSVCSGWWVKTTNVLWPHPNSLYTKLVLGLTHSQHEAPSWDQRTCVAVEVHVGHPGTAKGREPEPHRNWGRRSPAPSVPLLATAWKYRSLVNASDWYTAVPTTPDYLCRAPLLQGHLWSNSLWRNHSICPQWKDTGNRLTAVRGEEVGAEGKGEGIKQKPKTQTHRHIQKYGD